MMNQNFPIFWPSQNALYPMQIANTIPRKTPSYIENNFETSSVFNRLIHFGMLSSKIDTYIMLFAIYLDGTVYISELFWNFLSFIHNNRIIMGGPLFLSTHCSSI